MKTAVKLVITNESGMSVRRSPSGLISTGRDTTSEEEEESVESQPLLHLAEERRGKNLSTDSILDNRTSHFIAVSNLESTSVQGLQRRFSDKTHLRSNSPTDADPLLTFQKSPGKFLEGGGFLAIPAIRLSGEEASTNRPTHYRTSSMRRIRSHSMQMPVDDFPDITLMTQALLPSTRNFQGSTLELQSSRSVDAPELFDSRGNKFYSVTRMSRKGSHYGSTELFDGDLPLDEFELDTPPMDHSQWSFGGIFLPRFLRYCFIEKLVQKRVFFFQKIMKM